jgi:AcrR family transcriptional regulator
LIYENGFKATSIDRVMHDSQLTKGAFYHHFKNKKELGLAVINTKIENKLEEAMIAPLNQPGNPFEIIKTTFINGIKKFTAYDKKHGCPINNLINEIGDLDESYRKSLQNIIEKWTAVKFNNGISKTDFKR